MEYDLNGRTIMITGANSGIGKAAAIRLAGSGAKVILACRSRERGMQALSEIQASARSADIDLICVDMSSQSSIRQFVTEFLSRHDRLDVLIHNAANFDLKLKQPVLTADGVETIFATNHVGVFLMTMLLLDILKKSAPSRMITVASKGLMVYPMLDIEFDNLDGSRKFSAQHAYYQSKLAQIMFTYDLAERLTGTGVTVNCARVTSVAVPDERLDHLPAWMRSLYSIKRKMSISSEQQARSYVFLAADPSVESITGGYWDENNHQVKSNAKSYNRETWKKLWSVSQRLAGIEDTESIS